jgi:predicted ATPase
MEFNLSDMRIGKYGFEIGAREKGGFSVRHERLEIFGPNYSKQAYYEVKDGHLSASEKTMPKAVQDRLYLVVASGIPAFREVYDSLSSMGFYNLNPEAMKELQPPDAGELLHRDGDNIASVIARLAGEAPPDKERVEQYLNRIVSGVQGVQRQTLGPRETLEFRQGVEGSKHPWHFPAASMSDGTLRALGILVAVSQLANLRDRVLLVGIEEPETALHPAASKALMDALEEAQNHTQIIITTHSADLLDKWQFDTNGLLMVQSKAGETKIAPIDKASRDAIRDHLYSAGEMLRMDQLELDQADLERQRQGSLFSGSEANT